MSSHDPDAPETSAAGEPVEPGPEPEPEPAPGFADGRHGLRGAWPWLRWPVYGFGALVLVVLAVGAWLWASTELPPTPSVEASAVLVDHNGEELAVLAQDGLRLEVDLDDVAPVAVDALVAAEDRRFYDHGGIDPAGIVRALWNNITDDSTQGGSTLTQQLVKNTYLDNDQTLTRKVREAVLAIKLDRTEDKDVILERYLNTVYFGRGAYGIEAAARTWFNATAADLTAEQAALLTGMLRAPESLGPDQHPDAARERRDAVLDAMVDMGNLEPEEAERAKATPVEVVPTEPTPTVLRAGVAPHFVEHVRGLLVEQFGEQALYDRGLVVHTTLDLTDQRAAEAAVAAVAANLDDPGDPQAAVVGVDRYGAVRAWVGGRDFDALQVDLVSDAGGTGRQPGSTFKPVTLAANLEAGNGAGQRFPAPAQIRLDVGADEPWEVSNAGGRGYGTLSLAQATINSVNTVYAQAVMQVGAEAVVDMANRLGVDRQLEPHPSIALGAQEVSVLEMAAVYSTLARSGMRIEPFVMTKVETRDGDVLWELEESGDQVVEPAVADTVNAVLQDTPRRGTARRAALERPMAAKTGTTQNNADAWLAGYTPEYTAVVWVGNPQSNETIPEVDGRQVQGGTVPAQIWHDFMVEALADVPTTDFAEPDDDLLRNPNRRSKATERAQEETEREPRTTRSTTTTTRRSTTTSAPEGNDGGPEDERDAEGGDGTTSTTSSPSTTSSSSTTSSPSTTSSSSTTSSPSTTSSSSTTASSSTSEDDASPGGAQGGG
jgi:penicillin-binding protein 1A